MLVNLINCDASKLKEGLPVNLAWERLSDDFNIPVFEPA